MLHIEQHRGDKLPQEQRLISLYNKISETLQSYDVVHCAFEDPFSAQARTAKVLGKFVAAVVLACEHNMVPYQAVTPQQVKKHATGSDKADKKAMLDACPVKGISDDEADAYFIATLCMAF